MNPNKVTGIDYNFLAKILKISSDCISQSLPRTINSTFEIGVFPSKWKIAKISAISKGKRETYQDNYKPTFWNMVQLLTWLMQNDSNKTRNYKIVL